MILDWHFPERSNPDLTKQSQENTKIMFKHTEKHRKELLLASYHHIVPDPTEEYRIVIGAGNAAGLRRRGELDFDFKSYRDIDHQIYLESLLLDEHHCDIVWNSSSWCIQDAASTFGVSVNDELVPKGNFYQALAPGDIIRLGPGRTEKGRTEDMVSWVLRMFVIGATEIDGIKLVKIR
jgi:hypothetical protein